MGHSRRVCIISLGCAKNLADSEAILGQVAASDARVQICSSPDDADVVIINTCGFLRAARDEAEATITAVERTIGGRPGSRVVVTGCYSQLWKSEVARRHPGLFAILGVDALYQEPFWQSVLKTNADATAERAIDVATRRTFAAPRLVSGQGSYAYLKVSDGCSQHCSYCTIPAIKGRLVSRTVDTILGEAQDLIRTGISEVVLVSQNTSAYGMDLSQDGKPLLEVLLKELDGLRGVSVIRLLYLYPTLVTTRLLEAIGASAHIAHYVDIPLQHTSPEVLKAMKRPWAESTTTGLIRRVRAVLPDAALRSTFIVGFPGETEEQFGQLLIDIREMHLEHASAFAYSREPLAPSSSYRGQVHWATKQRRLRGFMEVQQEESLAMNQARYVGHTCAVMVDSVAEDEVLGRTLQDAPEVDNLVHLKNPRKRTIVPGSIWLARISSAGAYDLEGKVL
jgi:ribosomal protein S12 methylthiotransferase